MNETVEAAITAARTAIDEAALAIEAEVGAGDWDAALRSLAALERLRSDLADVIGNTGVAVAPMLPVPELAIEGVGTFRRGTSKRTVTHWEPILDELVDRARVDHETGEVRDARAAVLWFRDSIAAIAPLTASNDARVAALGQILGAKKVPVEDQRSDGEKLVRHESLGRVWREDEWKAPGVSVRPVD